MEWKDLRIFEIDQINVHEASRSNGFVLHSQPPSICFHKVSYGIHFELLLETQMVSRFLLDDRGSFEDRLTGL